MVAITYYRELEIWKRAMDLCEEIYRATEKFPRQEQYGLCSQMRRGSVSIPSNIAEGFVRKHSKEFRHHLSIALGSLAELDTQILIAERLGYLENAETEGMLKQTESLGKMMTKFYQGIKIS